MNQREASRKEWTASGTLEEINAGSLQRIADATEKMAASYDALRNDRDLYRRWYDEGRARSHRLELRIRALRGVITRMKRSRGR